MYSPIILMGSLLVFCLTSNGDDSCSSSEVHGKVLGSSLFHGITADEMKRRQKVCDDSVLKKPKASNWSLGLLDSMKDPHLIINEDDTVVIIKDKYPKATHHYLILPKDNIESIFKLNKSHIALLEKFGVWYEGLQESHRDVKLRAGFHAIPSMKHLHMHVISQDMLSPCLKTKTHWNSFTTSYFIPYQDVLRQLRENGSITKISDEKHKSLLATPLKCNQCDVTPKNMPKLKEHLLTHQ